MHKTLVYHPKTPMLRDRPGVLRAFALMVKKQQRQKSGHAGRPEKAGFRRFDLTEHQIG